MYNRFLFRLDFLEATETRFTVNANVMDSTSFVLMKVNLLTFDQANGQNGV